MAHILHNTLTNNRFYNPMIAPLGLGDLKTISSNLKIGNDSILETILEKNLQLDKPFEEICIGDIADMLIALRILTTEDDTIGLSFNCPKCKFFDTKHIESISKFERMTLNDSINEINDIILKSGTKVSIELPKIKHKRKLKAFLDQFPHYKFLNQEVLSIASHISFEDTSNILEIYHRLNSTEDKLRKDAIEINRYIEKELKYGIIPIILTKCPKCGEVSQLRLNFRYDFFL